MKDYFLKSEWEKLNNVRHNYNDFEDYKNFMNECAEQYRELKKIVKNYNESELCKEHQSKLEFFKNIFYEIIEFGYNNYQENEYIDFNYKNLTCTVTQDKNNNIYLSSLVEIWNDGICTCEYTTFNIEKYLV